MNQSSTAEVDDARERGGKLNLTFSVLIRHEDLHTALRQHVPELSWDKKLVHTLREHEQSTELSNAIEPLFNDIADRKRGLFVEDFLIDTLSDDDLRSEYGPNVCDLIDIDVPKRINWDTEGQTLRADLSHPVRFETVRCRAFWVSHSNNSLSYHLSFEISYDHTASHYYALSLVQKVFFPTEGTKYIYNKGTSCPSVTSQLKGGVVAVGLAGYVEERFKRDAVHLFQSILGDPQRGRKKADGDTLVETLLYRGPKDKDSCLADWDRKCVSVLEDPYFFWLLHNSNRSKVSTLDSIVPDEVERGILSYSDDILAACDQDELAYYFLSGFFQNIIDFLRQDISEVLDGTDPIYPPPSSQDDSGYFIVYATPVSLYEVVTQSRSLAAGQGWIGTCPYLFLVHLMTLHNENLVHRYEQQVRGLIDHLDKVRRPGTDDRQGSWRNRWSSEDTFEKFRRFRLTTFDEVQRHRYFNVLRYDTEREFYQSIEEVRGIRQREEYWATVVTGLESTIDDLRDAEQRRFDSRRNRLLAGVTVIGVLQVAFEVLDYFFEKGVAQLGWAVGLTSVAMILASTLVWPWWKKLRRRRT